MAITYEKTNFAGKLSQEKEEKSITALDFRRKATHYSMCLMNSSLYIQGISQILKGFRSTPDKFCLCGITTAMLAGTCTKGVVANQGGITGRSIHWTLFGRRF